MDIGFGSLIEKFEEYVGKRATRVLIIVIFVAVFALCAKAIADNLITPILAFFRTPLWSSTLIEIAFLAGAAAAGIAGGTFAMASFTQWQAAKRTLSNMRKAKVLSKDARANMRESRTTLDQTSELLDGVTNLNDKSIALSQMLIFILRHQLANPKEYSEEQASQMEKALDEAEQQLQGLLERDEEQSK